MTRDDLPEPTDGLGPWQEYLCRACGLIYNEGEGDPDGGIAPGTRFEDIPDDWVCPVCGVGKGDFEPYERPSAPAMGEVPVAAGKGKTGVVIVGAGLAGWAVARSVRQLDADCPITIVTADAGQVYNKPELSNAMSRKADKDTLTRSNGHDEAARLGIRLLPFTHAVGLAPQFKRLRTTRGTIDYTHLVLAFGARSQIPAGLDPHHAWRINSLDAWNAFQSHLDPDGATVAVVGGGMIGVELAEDMARSGHSVTLIGRGSYPLEQMVPREAGAYVANGLQRAGVTWMGDSVVAESRRLDDGRVALALDGGQVIEAEEVVSAAGLAIETRFLRNAGVDVSPAGIVVESAQLATNVDDIFAMGDCIAIHGAPCRFIEPIPRQAEVIAHTILGLDHESYGHRDPVIRLKSKEAPLTMSGPIRADGEWRVIQNDGEALAMELWQDDTCIAKLAS